MTERYELINREESHYPTSSMCRWAGVSRSGYYSWRDRPESITRAKRKELSIIIKDVFKDSDDTYGYRRIQAYLYRRGVRVDGATIRSIMRELSLEAGQPRAKVRTTVPAEDLDERPDLVGRDFTADEPGRKWCGDITYIDTWAGFVYLATVLDCCTKKVVGYAMADHMRTSLVCEAIDMAARRCPVEKGVTVFPLRPGKSVHVSEVPGPPEDLWNPSVRGAYRSVLGQCLGGVIQCHAQERKGA